MGNAALSISMDLASVAKSLCKTSLSVLSKICSFYIFFSILDVDALGRFLVQSAALQVVYFLEVVRWVIRDGRLDVGNLVKVLNSEYAFATIIARQK